MHALEQKLLHPVNTRVAVFLSLANRQALELDSVELFVNEQPVTAHLYTENERSSLGQGGVHQLFIGNLVDGRHTLKAVINARAANNRFVRREIVHDFRKQPGTLRLQMTLNAKAPGHTYSTSSKFLHAYPLLKGLLLECTDEMQQCIAVAIPNVSDLDTPNHTYTLTQGVYTGPGFSRDKALCPIRCIAGM